MFKGYSTDHSSLKTGWVGGDIDLAMTDCSDLSREMYRSTSCFFQETSKFVKKISQAMESSESVEIEPSSSVQLEPLQAVSVVTQAVSDPVPLPLASKWGWLESFVNGFHSLWCKMPGFSNWLSNVELTISFPELAKSIYRIYPASLVNWSMNVMDGIQQAIIGTKGNAISFVLSLIFLIGFASVCLHYREFFNSILDLIRLGFSTSINSTWIVLKTMGTSFWSSSKWMFGRLANWAWGVLLKIHARLMEYKLYKIVFAGIMYICHTVTAVKAFIASTVSTAVWLSKGFFWWCKYLINGSDADYNPLLRDRFGDFGLFMKAWSKGRSSLNQEDRLKLDGIVEFLQTNENCNCTLEELSQGDLLSPEVKDRISTLFRAPAADVTAEGLEAMASAASKLPSLTDFNRSLAASEVLLTRLHLFISNLKVIGFTDYNEFSQKTRLALGFQAFWLREAHRDLDELFKSPLPLSSEDQLRLNNLVAGNRDIQNHLAECTREIDIMLRGPGLPEELVKSFPPIDFVINNYIRDLRRDVLSRILDDAECASRGTSVDVEYNPISGSNSSGGRTPVVSPETSGGLPSGRPTSPGEGVVPSQQPDLIGSIPPFSSGFERYQSGSSGIPSTEATPDVGLLSDGTRRAINVSGFSSAATERPLLGLESPVTDSALPEVIGPALAEFAPPLRILLGGMENTLTSAQALPTFSDPERASQMLNNMVRGLTGALPGNGGYIFLSATSINDPRAWVNSTFASGVFDATPGSPLRRLEDPTSGGFEPANRPHFLVDRDRGHVYAPGETVIGPGGQIVQAEASWTPGQGENRRPSVSGDTIVNLGGGILRALQHLPK